MKRLHPCIKCGSEERRPWDGSCRPCAYVRAEKWRRNNYDKVQDLLFQKKYGITYADYKVMLIQQDECCAICGHEPLLGDIRLSVDHNHSTGKVRALLCHKCNRGIGALQDSPEVVLTAYQYLIKHAEAQATGDI